MISDVNLTKETKRMEISDLRCGDGTQSQRVQCWRGASREMASSSTEPMNKAEKSQVICWANCS